MSFEFTVPPDRLTKPCVAIVGFTDHRVQALALPQDRFELWGLNELHRYHTKEVAEGRFSRWFEVHPRDVLEPDPEHLKTLGQMTIPVYMHRHWDDIPPSVPFPRHFIEEALGETYFTSSIAWEIAYAILLIQTRWAEQGHRDDAEIHVYGVDMAQETEYAEQRNCCEFWLGVAKGMGIKTYVPPTADLLKAIGQYGFGETATEFSLKLKERLAWLHAQDNDRLANIRGLDAEYESKKAQLEHEYRSKREPLTTERNQIVGAIQDCMYWERSWAIKNAAPAPGGPTPDRSLDPRTGITEMAPMAAAADSKDGKKPRKPVNRIAAMAGKD